MEMDKARRLRETWGNRPCSHPQECIEGETIQGTTTGDLICTQCGEVFLSAREVKRAQKNPNQ
jgi:hypothetical protein